jgi:SAM-dependent methyltransferase
LHDRGVKNETAWRPGKYAMIDGRLAPSLDPGELSPSSRLIARLLCDRWQDGIERHARGALLDLGCGKVPLWAAYRSRVERATCVDWPGSAHGSAHVDVACDLAGALPFGDASFDTVISSDVLEHLPDPGLAVGEIGRVLARGGRLLLNTPFLYGLHEEPHDYHRHTRHSLALLCAAAGLSIVSLEEIGGLGDVLADLGAKAMGPLPLAGATLGRGIQHAALLLGSTSAGRRWRARTAPAFPLGYFLVAEKG